MKQQSWKTTLLGLMAAAAGILGAEQSPAPKPVKQISAAVAWVLLGGLGAVAKDHQEN